MRYLDADSKISRFCDAALQLLFPPGTYCIVCGKYIDDTRTYLLCDHCIRNMRFGLIEIDLERQEQEIGIRAELDSVRSCMRYGLYEKRLVFGLKYNKKTFIARVISEIMYDRILSEDECAEELLNCDYIIPTAMTGKKQRQRGFNQTAKIGKYLSKKTKIPMLEGVVIKNRETDSQKSVSGFERYTNQLDLYSVKPEKRSLIEGKYLLLLDDVYTTGATSNSIASALKAAGAAKVHFISLATGNDFVDDHIVRQNCQRDTVPESHQKRVDGYVTD